MTERFEEGPLPVYPFEEQTVPWISSRAFNSFCPYRLHAEPCAQQPVEAVGDQTLTLPFVQRRTITGTDENGPQPKARARCRTVTPTPIH